jgi:hypothetical protein
MLLTIFISCPKATADTLHISLERLNLTPVSSEQIALVLLSPFVEQFSSILQYARVYCEIGDDMAFSSFLADVAVRCLEVSSKVVFHTYSSGDDSLEFSWPGKYASLHVRRSSIAHG